jgi:ribosomal protein L34
VVRACDRQEFARVAARTEGLLLRLRHINGRQIVVARDRLLAREAVTSGEEECDNHHYSGQGADEEPKEPAAPFGDLLSAMSSSANPPPHDGERRAPEMSSADDRHAFDR